MLLSFFLNIILFIVNSYLGDLSCSLLVFIKNWAALAIDTEARRVEYSSEDVRAEGLFCDEFYIRLLVF